MRRRALVEGERNVRAECGLDAHRLLRAEKAIRTIKQRLECHPPLGDLDLGASRLVATPPLDLVGDATMGQREDLEAAGVRDDRPLPAHETVQPPSLGDLLLAGGEVEVE